METNWKTSSMGLQCEPHLLMHLGAGKSSVKKHHCVSIIASLLHLLLPKQVITRDFNTYS